MKRKTVHILWFILIITTSCNLFTRNNADIVFPEYNDTIKYKGYDYRVMEMVMCHNDIQHIDTFDLSNQIINLNKQPKKGEYHNSSLDGYPWPEDSIKLHILIDTARIIPSNNRIGYIFASPPPIDLTELDSSLYCINSFNSSEKSIDNKKLEYGLNGNWINNYPVFIVNKSDTIVSLSYESISGFEMIHEAKDSLGFWKPIQYCKKNWCGNTYSFIDLKPYNYALTRVPKFSGSFKTCLRLKLRFFNRFYYSKEFNGSINYSQFVFPKEKDFYTEQERKYMLLTE